MKEYNLTSYDMEVIDYWCKLYKDKRIVEELTEYYNHWVDHGLIFDYYKYIEFDNKGNLKVYLICG